MSPSRRCRATSKFETRGRFEHGHRWVGAVLVALACHPVSPPGRLPTRPRAVTTKKISIAPPLPASTNRNHRCALAERWLSESQKLAESGRPLRAMAYAERAIWSCPTLATRAQPVLDFDQEKLKAIRRSIHESASELVDAARKAVASKSLSPELAEKVLLSLMNDGTAKLEWVPALGEIPGWQGDSLSWSADNRSVVVGHSAGISILTAPSFDEKERWDLAPSASHKARSAGDSLGVLVAVSPKEALMATTAADAPIELIGTERRVLAAGGRKTLTTVLAFSPDGAYLVTDEAGDSLTLRENPGFEIVGTLPIEHDVMSLRFSKDSRFLAVLDDVGGYSVFDLHSRKRVVKQAPELTGLPITAADISQDLTHIVRGVSSNLEVQDARSGRRLGSRLFYSCHTGVSARAILQLPNGHEFVSSGAYAPWPGEVNVVERTTLRELRTLPSEGFIAHLALSPDGTVLAGTGSTVNIWDLPRSKLIRSWGGSGPQHERTEDAIISPSGRLILVPDTDTAVASATRALVQLPKYEGLQYPMRLEFGATDRLMAVADSETLYLVNPENASLAGRRARGYGFVLAEDGQTLAAAEYDALRIWNARDNTLLTVQRTPASPNLLAGSLESGWLAFMEFDEVVLYDVRQQRRIATGQKRSKPKALMPARDGQSIWVASDTGFEILDPQKPKRGRLLPTALGTVNSLAMNRQGNLVVAMNCRNEVEVWSSAGERLWKEGTNPTSNGSSGCLRDEELARAYFSVDGTLLIRNVPGSASRVVAARTGKNVITVTGNVAGRGFLARSDRGDVELLGNFALNQFACRLGVRVLPPEICLEALEWTGMTRDMLGD